MLTTTNAPAIVGQAQTGALVLGPVAATSTAFAEAVTSVVYITQDTNAYRVPRVTADPVASWVREGEEIAPSDASLDELTIVPAKVAGLSIISRELANDSNPAAAESVGAGLARDIARRVDEAFCGALAAPAPSGLAALAGTTDVDAGTAWADLDPFAEAISAGQQEGATLTAFLASPADALALAYLRQGAGSNVPLLGADPRATGLPRMLLGVPLIVARDLAPGTIYGVDSSRLLTVVREDVDVTSDASVFFTSDRVAVRAVARIGFGFPHPASVVRLTLSES